MKKSLSRVIAAILVVVLVVLPVSGAVAPPNADTTPSPAANEFNAVLTKTVTQSDSATTVATSTTFITATVSSATPHVGDPVTISGVANGGNLTSGIQIWVFAGNYVDVTTVPVNADGTYSKTYPTTGLPPATYFVFVQSPGVDGMFDIDLYDAGTYSGQVVDTKTKATVFNFTGTGSVQDAAASKALSDALNLPGQDDIYSKLTFQVTAQVATPLGLETASTMPPAAPPTKTSLPFEVTAGALVISGCCAAFCMRKTF